MLTGICPKCRFRLILVKIIGSDVRRVRTHECGALLVPHDVQPLPRLPLSPITGMTHA